MTKEINDDGKLEKRSGKIDIRYPNLSRSRMNTLCGSFLSGLIVLLFPVLLFSQGYSEFVARFDISNDKYHLDFSDHKFWIEISNVDPNISGNYRVELYSNDLVISDFAERGYSFQLTGGADTVWRYFYTKTIHVPYEEKIADYMYLEVRAPDFHGAPPIVTKTKVFQVRVYDDNDDIVPSVQHYYGSPSGSGYFNGQVSDLDVSNCGGQALTNLFDDAVDSVSVGPAPYFLGHCNRNKYWLQGYRCAPDPEGPFGSVWGGEPGVGAPHLERPVDWFIKGDIFLQCTGSYSTFWPGQVQDSTYYLADSYFEHNDNVLYRPNLITLLGDTSRFYIIGQTTFDAKGLRVTSGKGGKAKGLYVEKGSRLKLRNALIEDQSVGITLESGAYLELDGVYFTDNEIGIHILPGTGEETVIRIKDTYFTGTGISKKAPYAGQFPLIHIKGDESTKVILEIEEHEHVYFSQSSFSIHTEGDVFEIRGGGEINHRVVNIPGLSVGGTYTVQNLHDGIEVPERDYPHYEHHHSLIRAAYHTSPGTGIYAVSESTADILLNASSNKVFKIIGTDIGIDLENVNFEGEHISIEDNYTGQRVRHNDDKRVEMSTFDISNSLIGIRIMECSESEFDYSTGVMDSMVYGIFMEETENSKLDVLEVDITSELWGLLLKDNTNARVLFEDGKLLTLNFAAEIRSNTNGEYYIKDSELTGNYGLKVENNTNIKFQTDYSKYMGDYAGNSIIGNTGSNIHIRNNENSSLNTAVLLEGNLACRIDVRENELMSYKDVVISQFNRRSNLSIGNNDIYARRTLEQHPHGLHGIWISERSMGSPFSEDIWDEYSLPLGAYRITDNNIYMRGAQYGINAVDCRLLKVQNNIVTVKDDFDVYTNAYGIFFQGGEYNFIQCNDVYHPNLSDGSNGVYSYFFQNSIGNRVLNNGSSKVGNGMRFLGDNLNSIVKGNIFDRHSNGLVYGDNEFGVPAQVGVQEYHGNMWFSSVGSNPYDALNHQPFFTNNNTYIVNSSHNPVSGANALPPDVEPGFGEWFRPLNMSNNYVPDQSCVAIPNQSIDMDMAAFYAKNFYNVMGDSIGFGGYDTEMKASHYRHLYRTQFSGGSAYPAVSAHQFTSRGVHSGLVDGHIHFEQEYGDSTGTTLSALLSGLNPSMVLSATDSEKALYTALHGKAYLITGDTALLSGITNDLAIIAKGCVYELGEAVYIARAVLGPDGGIDYMDFKGCESGPLPKAENGAAGYDKLYVYPVPAGVSGEVNVLLPEGVHTVYLYTGTGVLYRVIESGGDTLLPVRIEIPGVYLLQASGADGKVYRGKVIVVE